MDADLALDPFELPDEASVVPSTRRFAEGKSACTAEVKKRRAAVRDISKTAVLGIRMFPSERRAVNAAAKRAGGREASAWAREIILASAAREELPSLDAGAVEELMRLRRDLNSGVGSNLNQAMKMANERVKGGSSPDQDALLRAALEAREVLETLRGDLARLISPRGRR